MKYRVLTLAIALSCSFHLPALDEHLMTRIAVVPLVNQSEDASLGQVGHAVTDTIGLTLRLMGTYRVEIPAGLEAVHDRDTARAFAEASKLDSLVLGSVDRDGEGALLFTVRLFDRQGGDFRITRTAKADSILDVFDAADSLTKGFLEALSGTHIGFGTVEFVNSGEPGDYEVRVDGASAGMNLPSLPKLLNGRHAITVVQERYFGEVEIARLEAMVAEDDTITLPFSVPYLTGAERLMIEGLFAKAGRELDDPTATGSDAILDEIAALAKDTPWAPRWSEFLQRVEALRNDIAEARARRNRGTLLMTSDPPGIRVLVDDSYQKTPFSLELDAGRHSYQSLYTVIDSVPYASQEAAMFSMVAGTELKVELKPELSRGTLTFDLVPPGYTVSINGVEVGTTPLAPLTVNTAPLVVRFEKQGARLMEFLPTLAAGGTAKVEWGRTLDSAFVLPRATIALDGKPDSWKGIPPLIEDVFYGRGILVGSDIVRVYLCRDANYVYWRVDFADGNAFWKKPKGMDKGIVIQVSIYVGTNLTLSSSVNYSVKNNSTDIWVGLFDEKTKTTPTLKTRTSGSFKISKDMIVARFPIEGTIQTLTGTREFHIGFAHTLTAGGWAYGSVWTPKRYVVFAP
jgi:hypothetical protein